MRSGLAPHHRQLAFSKARQQRGVVVGDFDFIVEQAGAGNRNGVVGAAQDHVETVVERQVAFRSEGIDDLA